MKLSHHESEEDSDYSKKRHASAPIKRTGARQIPEDTSKVPSTGL